MSADVTGNFSAAGGVGHMDCILQVTLFREGREIIGISAHFIAIPCLFGTAMPSPVMRNDSITLLAEEQHLSVPGIRVERPSVTEHYGLALPPVLVVNLCAIFRGDRRHNFSPCACSEKFLRNNYMLRCSIKSYGVVQQGRWVEKRSS